MALRIEHKDGRHIEFGVMAIPYRKKKALVNVKKNGAEVDVLAYFTTEENAETFNKIIHSIAEMCGNNE